MEKKPLYGLNLLPLAAADTADGKCDTPFAAVLLLINFDWGAIWD